MSVEEMKVVAADSEEQLVVFTLAEEAYGVSIEAVNTIIRMPEITAVPHTAAYIIGVMNLRGVIVPVIDLRTRFGLTSSEATKATRVVVVENHGMLVGMVVDTVQETLRMPASNIEPLSPLVMSVDSRYLRGVAKRDDKLIILLSLDQVVAEQEAEALSDMVEEVAGGKVAIAS